MRNFTSLLLTAMVLVVMACEEQAGEKSAKPVVFNFKETPGHLSDYWYQGKAEINHYELSQNRYRDVHPGEAIMIFVTEDFLTDKQVKNEQYREKAKSTLVLKNNMIRKFPTGIYDYSLMTSVFTPADVEHYPATLKVSTTAQEWCGHTYMQVNLDAKKYQIQLHSYFEEEADVNTTAMLAPLEDELFNRIRMDPASLPTGEFRMLPSTVYCRLQHRAFQPYQVKASLAPLQGNGFPGESLMAYQVEYPELKRTLIIVYENIPPYRISGWIDRHPSAFSGEEKSTMARLTKTMLDAYWQHNSLEDKHLREELGVKYFQ